jgi:hypothetical protein
MDVDDLIAYQRGRNGQLDFRNKHNLRGWQDAQNNGPVFGSDPSLAQGVTPPRTKRIMAVALLALIGAIVLMAWIARTKSTGEASSSAASTAAANPTPIAWRDGTDISSTTLKLMGLPAVTQLIQHPYRYATADLNGDGRPETIVQAANCAAGACETLVVETRGATARLVSNQRLQRDLAATSTVHNGFHVLAPAPSPGN